MDQKTTTKRTQEKSRPTGGERLVKQDTGGNAEAEVVLYQPDSRLLATTLLSISAIFLTRVNWMKIQYVRNPYELPRW